MKLLNRNEKSFQWTKSKPPTTANIKIWFSQNKNRKKIPYSIGNCHKLYELRTRIVFFFFILILFFCCGKALCSFICMLCLYVVCFELINYDIFFLSFLSCLVACCYRDKIYCSLSQTVFCYDNVPVWPMI